MSNIVSDSSSFEDLVRIINSLTLKINELEKKINIVESNSVTSYYDNEVNFDENIFRSIPFNAPPVTRQNAFTINL
jgi:hypothetical protein|tara:strand:- start:54 stop:281 length:228 start_codon:yes stop_codon:yes gene_type:complete